MTKEIVIVDALRTPVGSQGEVFKNVSAVYLGTSVVREVIKRNNLETTDVDEVIIGALQLDQQGNIASHMIPGKMVPGMGGAMDLVVGARKVIIAMGHRNKGNPKVFEKRTVPLTVEKAVDMIIMDMGVIEITEEGLAITELNDNFTFEEVEEVTEASLIRRV